MKNKKILVYSLVLLLVLSIIGISYAYFNTKISGNTNAKDFTAKSKVIKIEYSDGTEKLISNDNLFKPGSIIEKKFTVTNTGEKDLDFVVYLEKVTNTFNRINDIMYELYDNSDNLLISGVFPKSDYIIPYNNSIKMNESQSYVLKVKYLNSEENQIEDSGKQIDARVSFKDGNFLSSNVIANSKSSKNGTIYSETPLTKPAVEISTETEKTLSVTSDDYGNSYYFRGNPVDNYVDFAGMCWRIVRINGDGSIKLILEDQDEVCSSTMDGNWNIPTETGGTTKTGNYGYTEYAINTLTATDGTKNQQSLSIMNYLNGETDNTLSMAYAFKNFQIGRLSNYLDKLKSGDWCLNDKAYAGGSTSDDDYVIPLTNTEILDRKIKLKDVTYDSGARLGAKKTIEPTLKCFGTNMKKFGDNKTEMYVGTLTADELVYAGGKTYTSNNNYYLINNYQKSNNLFFWSLSPCAFKSFDNAFLVVSYTNSVDADIVRGNSKSSFRPSINLNNSIQISSGDGTVSDAYKIK